MNKALSLLHLIGQPVNWLGGLGFTVVLGLVYGYIPYLILVLYAGLDRIDPALIEAGRDLGLGRVRTFVHVTLPLSRQAILTGMLITVLPMLGDYFTNQLLVRYLGNDDVRQRDRRSAQLIRGSAPGGGRGLLAAVPARADRPHDLLRRGDQSLVAGGGMTAVKTPAAVGLDAGAVQARERMGQAAAPPQPLAAPVVPRGVHLALPGLVAGARRARGAVLVQQRKVAERLAGLLMALVLRGSGELGAA